MLLVGALTLILTRGDTRRYESNGYAELVAQ